MKLTDEERNSLVILQLEKAKVFLKRALILPVFIKFKPKQAINPSWVLHDNPFYKNVEQEGIELV